MATIDLTLDSFKVPAIESYVPPFGTKITKTEINKGGLSTVEVNSNIMMPFANMRPKIITENSVTSEIEYDAKLCFSASLLAGATLELDDGAYEGCRVQITNLSSFACDVEYNSATLVSIPTGANVEVLWTGSTWMLSTTGTIASGNVMPPSSSAVHAAIEDYVDASNSYSTTETLTGGTWLDGKPIYKKTVIFGQLPNNTQKRVAHEILNLGEVIILLASTTNGTSWLHLPHVNPNTIGNSIAIEADASNITITTGSDRRNYTICNCTLIYTKTTD